MIDMDKYNPNACPSCGSVNIFIYDEAADSINVWRYLACNDCGQRWNEEYTLTSAWTADKEDN